eukprot:TRINITY_DN1470_c0_g1_i1.p1 TRINITY_DN1470_c0_g1~~TRINITY_DN1470_c0_g1_i1.p1  ORF type:complete len:169 (-),score=15.93 TRINITY_DN1470_c0_g1_i1:79-585(-)
MYRLLALVCLAVYVAADCKPKDTNLHAYLCNNSTILKVDPTSISVDPYPPKISDKINLKFSYDNKGPALSRFDLDIPEIQYFGEELGSCGFHKIPLVKATIKCEDLGSDICPIPAGQNTITSQIDLSSSAIASIISKIGGDQYYQFNLEFKNGDTVLTCVTAQVYLSK